MNQIKEAYALPNSVINDVRVASCMESYSPIFALAATFDLLPLWQVISGVDDSRWKGIGPKVLHMEVNLNDRSAVKYPIILGRNALKENFVVDCAQSNCLPSTCQGAPPK